MFVMKVIRESCTHSYEFEDAEWARQLAMRMFNKHPEIIDITIEKK